MQIAFGELDKTWQQYDLYQAPLHFNNQQTQYKAIIYNGKIAAIVGKGYELFPNEEALKIADRAARIVGLEPFKMKVPGIETEDNVLYNKDRTRIRAIYIPKNGEIKITDRDFCKVGVQIYNSIDSTSAFGVGLFTFRGACSNGVIFGYRKICGIRKIHTKSLSAAIDTLKNRIAAIMDQASRVVADYREMTQIKLTEELAEQIKKSRISKRVLPDYLKEEEVKLPRVSVWDLYNDVTEAIWHNAKAGMRTKTHQFQILHQTLGVMAR